MTAPPKRDCRNIASLVLCFFILTSGITLSVLLYEIVAQVVKDSIRDSRDNNYSQRDAQETTNSVFMATGPFWLLGFAYIIPGLLGLLANGIRVKGAYITHLIFGIICLIVMGIFFIVGVIALAAIASHPSMGKECKEMNGYCYCRDSNGDYQQLNELRGCDVMTTAYTYGVSILAVLVIAWILMLVETVLAGMAACSRYDSPGAVIIQQQPVIGFQRLEETGVPPVIQTYPPPVYLHEQRTIA